MSDTMTTRVQRKVSQGARENVVGARKKCRAESPEVYARYGEAFNAGAARAWLELLLDDHYDGTCRIRPARLRERIERAYLHLCAEETEEPQS